MRSAAARAKLGPSAAMRTAVVLWTLLALAGAGTAQGQVPGAWNLPAAPTAAPSAAAMTDADDPGHADLLRSVIWQLEAYRTELGLKPAASGDGHGYVAFDADGFRINAGCDTLRGSYWLEGDRLLFSPHVASVIGDCPPTLRAQEQTVLALLPAVTRLRRADAGLLLLDADGQPLLTLTRPQTSPLQRRIWVLLAYRNRDDTIVPALPEPRFTLRFDNATRLSGRACDEYRGGFVRDEERFLALEGPLAGTRFGCREPAVNRQAEDYLAVLGQMDSYRVDAQSLLLRDADGRMIARFAAMDDSPAAAEQDAFRTAPATTAPRALPPAPTTRLPVPQVIPRTAEQPAAGVPVPGAAPPVSR